MIATGESDAHKYSVILRPLSGQYDLSPCLQANHHLSPSEFFQGYTTRQENSTIARDCTIAATDSSFGDKEWSEIAKNRMKEDRFTFDRFQQMSPHQMLQIQSPWQ